MSNQPSQFDDVEDYEEEALFDVPAWIFNACVALCMVAASAVVGFFAAFLFGY